MTTLIRVMLLSVTDGMVEEDESPFCRIFFSKILSVTRFDVPLPATYLAGIAFSKRAKVYLGVFFGKSPDLVAFTQSLCIENVLSVYTCLRRLLVIS